MSHGPENLEEKEIVLSLRRWVPLALGPAAEQKQNETEDSPPGPPPGEGDGAVLAVLKNYILGLLYACDVTHLQVNLHKGICKMNKTFCVMTVSNLTCLVGFKYTQIGPTTLFWDYTFMHYLQKFGMFFLCFF